MDRSQGEKKFNWNSPGNFEKNTSESLCARSLNLMEIFNL